MATLSSIASITSRSLAGPLILANSSGRAAAASHKQLTCSSGYYLPAAYNLSKSTRSSESPHQITVAGAGRNSLSAVRSFSGRPLIVSGVDHIVAGSNPREVLTGWELKAATSGRCMASQVTTSPDLNDAIIHDHRELEEFYTSYKKARQNRDDEEAEKWFNQFVWELCRHSVGEELVVYPLMDTLGPKGKELADKDRADHQKVKNELEEILRLNDPDRSETLLDRLMEDLRQHIKDEETEDLEFLKQNADPKSLETAAQAFMFGKKVAPTRPHAGIPNKWAVLEAGLGLFVTPVDKLRDLFTPYPKDENVPYQAGKQS
jgi:hemerythrin superfamily protein